VLQYKIPQNVQREDQILPFMTMKQLGILAIGGTIAYIFYTILAQFFFIEIWGPVVFIVLVITAAFAYIEINGVSFCRYLLGILSYNFSPKQRVWNHRDLLSYELEALINVPSTTTPPKKANKPISPPPGDNPPHQSLSDLVRNLEQKNQTLNSSDLSPLIDDFERLEHLEKTVKAQKEAQQAEIEAIHQDSLAKIREANADFKTPDENISDIIQETESKISSFKK